MNEFGKGKEDLTQRLREKLKDSKFPICRRKFLKLPFLPKSHRIFLTYIEITGEGTRGSNPALREGSLAYESEMKNRPDDGGNDDRQRRRRRRQQRRRASGHDSQTEKRAFPLCASSLELIWRAGGGGRRRGRYR